MAADPLTPPSSPARPPVEKVTLLRHAVNLGKGAALKTAINYALCNYPGLLGVITADADGQHHPDDIERVAAQSRGRARSHGPGSANLRRDVPLRSRFGNVVTRAVMRALVGATRLRYPDRPARHSRRAPARTFCMSKPTDTNSSSTC